MNILASLLLSCGLAACPQDACPAGLEMYYPPNLEPRLIIESSVYLFGPPIASCRVEGNRVVIRATMKVRSTFASVDPATPSRRQATRSPARPQPIPIVLVLEAESATGVVLRRHTTVVRVTVGQVPEVITAELIVSKSVARRVGRVAVRERVTALPN